jgi:hypothetical protein
MFSIFLFVAAGLLEYNANGKHAAATIGLYHSMLGHCGLEVKGG